MAWIASRVVRKMDVLISPVGTAELESFSFQTQILIIFYNN